MTTVDGVPVSQSASELEELLSDPKKSGAIFGDPVKRAEFINQYVRNTNRTDPDLQAQLREQVQMGIADFAQSAGFAAMPKADLSNDGTPQVAGTLAGSSPYAAFQARKNALYNKAARGGGEIDRQFTSQSQFFRALALQGGAMNRLHDGRDLLERLNKIGDLQNSFSTDAPADGGFLLPETLRSDLMMIALEEGVIRPRATVIPMSTQRVGIPAVDSTSNVSTVFGGISTTWLDESTAAVESSAKFQQVWLDSKKLMAYCTAPNELVADATAFGAFLDAALPQALAFEEDYRFMQGDGSAKPLGYVSSPGSVTASAVSGQGANTIIPDNLAAMFSRMLPGSLNKAIWVASIDCFPQLALMTVTGALGNSTPVWMNNGLIDGPPISIYGRPVYFTEKHPALGSSGDIMFIDPKFYLIGDRQSIEVSASPHFLFSTDKTAYKIIERVDGRPWVQSALTPKNNSSNTLSPYVQLSGTRT